MTKQAPSTYTTLSRYAWLWTSGVCTANAGWAAVAGSNSAALGYALLGGVLLSAFVVLR